MTYYIKAHRYEASDPRLGRHVHHDSRNLAYAFEADPATTVQSVKWTSHLPITDQGNVGACVGFSDVDLLGYDLYWNALSQVQQQHLAADPNGYGLTFYSTATHLDSFPGDYPPDDTGSDGPSGAKALVKLGYASGYQHVFSFNDFLAALMKGPVMCGTEWLNSMFNPDAEGILAVDQASGVAGGHEYDADEYDQTRGLIGFRQHWGGSWGLQGRFYIPAESFQSILSHDGDATIPTPLTAPAPQPRPPAPAVDADVLRSYKSLHRWAVRNGVA